MTPPEPGEATAGGLVGRLRRLGPAVERRPPPSLGVAASGTGGALVAAATTAVAGERWSTGGGAAAPALLTAAVLGAGVALVVRARPPLPAAGVGASAVAAPALAFFLAAGDGFPSLRAVAVLAGALLLGLYAAGPWRGHTFHLAVLVVAGWLLALSLAGVSVPGTGGGLRTLDAVLRGAGAASLAVGLAYLFAGQWLHGRGLEGMATAFLAVGDVALPLGALLLVRRHGEVAVGAAAVAAGAVVAVVGARCRRRGTLWAGVAVVGLGTVAVAGGVAPDGEVLPTALALAAGGAVLVLLGALAAPLVSDARQER